LSREPVSRRFTRKAREESGPYKFRIKITGADGIVNDNQLGATDDADPSTAIAGGHIVIRK
jgi:hypothetical protein